MESEESVDALVDRGLPGTRQGVIGLRECGLAQATGQFLLDLGGVPISLVSLVGAGNVGVSGEQ